jgi:hypothetical protein
VNLFGVLIILAGVVVIYVVVSGGAQGASQLLADIRGPKKAAA